MCFLGAMHYLLALAPGDTPECVFGEAIPNTTSRYRYCRNVFPRPLPTLPMSKDVAFDYLVECMCVELRMRVCGARVHTFTSRMKAMALLTNRLRREPLSVAAWEQTRDVVLEPRTWSDKQQEFLDVVADRINIRDSSDLAGGLSRWMHITGGPGTGKTEVIIHTAYRAAEIGSRV